MGDRPQRGAAAPDYKDLRTSVQPVATIGGGGAQNADVQFLVNGPDLKKLEEIGKQLVAKDPQHPRHGRRRQLAEHRQAGAVDRDRSRPKASDLGVPIADAAEALRLLVGGDQVTTYNESGEQYEVHLRALAENRSTEQAIAALPGAVVTPGQRAAREHRDLRAERSGCRHQSSRAAAAGDGLRQHAADGVAGGSAERRFSREFDRLNPGAGYRGGFSGRSKELGRAAQNFVLAFVLSLVFMYLILAAQFESWLHPITILLSLPLDVAVRAAVDHHLPAIAEHLLGARPAGAVWRREEELDPPDRSRQPAEGDRACLLHDAIVQAPAATGCARS